MLFLHKLFNHNKKMYKMEDTQTTKKLFPLLRYDLNFRPFKEKEHVFIHMSDPFGYATQPIVLHNFFYNLFAEFAVEITIEEVETILMKKYNQENIITELRKIIDLLDKEHYLINDRFEKRKLDVLANYEKLECRPPICMGANYPDTKTESIEFFRGLFDSVNPMEIDGNNSAVIVPHLDFRTSKTLHQAYAKGYHSIRNTEADVYVILGTSHSLSSDYFMFTDKKYQSTYGVAENDTELFDEIKKNMGDKFTVDNLAHKVEHSIEFQVALLQHYLNKADVKILPVLCGSLMQNIKTKSNPMEDKKYMDYIKAIQTSIEKLGRKAVFITSVDLSHVGKKFGDKFDALEQKDNVLKAENIMLEKVINHNPEKFFTKIAEKDDKWKVCGVAGITATLNILPKTESKLLAHNLWYEKAVQSSVSFATIAIK
jgi:AmmeMemoRadiSam system protein B